MRVLVLYAHPVPTSYVAALHGAVVAALRDGGHDVDDCDLYAEQFEPRLSRLERETYHDLDRNRDGVGNHVDRLLSAEALVLVYPVWNFGFPAILKGYFDRVFLPGVSFRMTDGKVVPTLHNITTIAVVTTYGGSRLRAVLAGDPPRKFIRRVLRFLIKPGGRVTYLAHYDMNRSTSRSRASFLDRVRRAMTEIA